MSQTLPVAHIYGTLLELNQELKDFADTSRLKVAFDVDGTVYIIGNGFVEKLQDSNFNQVYELKAEIRRIIARYCPRVHPYSHPN